MSPIDIIRAVGVLESIVGIEVEKPFDIIEIETDEEGVPQREQSRINIPVGVFKTTLCYLGGSTIATHCYVHIECEDEEMPLLSVGGLADLNAKGVLRIIE